MKSRISRVDRKSFGYQRPTRTPIRSSRSHGDIQPQLAAASLDLLSPAEEVGASIFDGHLAGDTQMTGAVETPKVRKPRGRPPSVKDPGAADIIRGAGAGLDHEDFDIHVKDVKASKIPRAVKAASRGEIVHAVHDTQSAGDDLAKNILILREKYYDLRTLMQQRVGTVNRIRAHCRHVVAMSDPKYNVFFATKEDENVSKEVKAAKKEAHSIADDLYDCLKEGKSHPLMISAIAAAGPLLEAVEAMERGESEAEKIIAKTAKRLPVSQWAIEQRGLSLLALGKIVGVAGDLNRFQTENGGAAVQKFWKYMEVGLVSNSSTGIPERQRRRSNVDEALAHGYGGIKRSMVWNIGGSLIGGMGKGKRPGPGEDIDAIEGISPYEALFMKRLRHHGSVDAEAHFKGIVKNAKGEDKESYSKHAFNMAKRYVEKRLLKLLYLEWRRSTGRSAVLDPPFVEMP